MEPRRPVPHSFASHLAVVAATLLLAALHAPLTAAQEQPPPWLLCGPPSSPSGNYTENNTYQANINRLSTTLPKNASSTPILYATDSVGSVPDVVYALALCRGDTNASACESCVATAFRGAQQRCPLFKDVMIFYDLCQLRFSNRNFFLDDDYFVNTYYLQGSQVTSTPVEAFDAAVRLLVNATADYTAEKSSRKFGTGEEGFDKGNSKIYALSQCTPDKTVDICRTCLSTIIGQLPINFNGTNGGGIFGVWCSFRYELYPFFSGRPLLQLPAFVATPPPAPPATRIQEKSRNKTGIVLAIVMPTTCALLAITVICFWRRRRSAAQYFPPYSTSSDDIQEADMLLLDLSTLRTATEDFAESKMLGKGGFGMVYKGILHEGQEIAVKRLCQSSSQGIGELKSELVLVAKLHHKNLVRLIGVCLQEHEKILVYEYMPNKSLDTILFDSERKKELDWVKRFKIINGIARGLQYLHEDSQLKIVHRDLKASNILLDFDYVPKISDFGLAKNFVGDQTKYVTHRIAGTYGYMAPEYAMCGHYSIKSDVFSFGVLVLEIVTGRRNSGSYNSNQDVDLLTHVWEHWTRGNVMELIDPSLSDHPPIEQMLKCIHIGLLCVQRKPAARPMMSWVNIMLSSSTVRLPSLSRPAFWIQDQEVSASDSSGSYLATPPGASYNSVVMSCNEASITELFPR
ncbi:cysteine-rich receptor-like protein kinase 6 [Phragmites australis]|uniref:cysteine-rich receptor-like protein kinase 6 n=1 Tax=Phragmites australis TaxID=29695 RepID=UPI002D791FAC|nr:cysteine-rich receptor-like protein kinase 6 [Phragmites australis]